MSRGSGYPRSHVCGGAGWVVLGTPWTYPPPRRDLVPGIPTPYPPEQNDRHLWKHYLPPTSLAGSKNQSLWLTSRCTRAWFRPWAAPARRSCWTRPASCWNWSCTGRTDICRRSCRAPDCCSCKYPWRIWSWTPQAPSSSSFHPSRQPEHLWVRMDGWKYEWKHRASSNRNGQKNRKIGIRAPKK